MTRVWRLRPSSPDTLSFADRTGLSPVEAQILINRGISDEKDLDSYLLPRLSSLLDPILLKDMEEAVSLVVKALERSDPITIYGDYDADGLTATAVLMNFLSGLNTPVFSHIPNRLTEGYGLHAQAVDSIARHRGGLLITVDCGTSNREEIALARELGMQVVVTDHHQVPEGFEPLCPVVNPHRPDCPFPFKGLSGVGLAFFLCVALRARLRERGWFRNRAEPDLRRHLDLVALGTIADMVPLLDQNRILVHSGLERMRDSWWPGVKALREVAAPGASATLSSDDLAFRLAPRLNASGRLGDAETGIRTLTTGSHVEARELARKLNELNGRRQALERVILNQIEEAMVGRLDLRNQRTLVLAGKDWHKGVLGIVASRLTERYHRPAVVLDVQDGVAAGSGRSIPGFDLYRALARLKPFLRRFGGHRHAAGLSLESSRIEAFAEELEAIAHDQIRPEDLIPAVDVDAEVGLADLDLQTVERIRSFGPFGMGNPEPVLYTPALEVLGAAVVGERHLRLKVRQDAAVVEGIGFGLAGQSPPGGTRVNLVYTPEVNRWQGFKRVEIRIVDFERVGQESKIQRTPPVILSP